MLLIVSNLQCGQNKFIVAYRKAKNVLHAMHLAYQLQSRPELASTLVYLVEGID